MADFTEVRKALMEPKPTFMDLVGAPKRDPNVPKGNPKGCSKEQRKELCDIRLELSPYVPEVVYRLIKMIKDEGTEDRDRLKAIELFLNRVFGKPTERVEITAADNVEDMSARQIESRIMGIIDALPAANNKKVQFKALTSKRKVDNAF